MDSSAQRAALTAAAREQGLSLSALSRAIGRNPAYIQQYLERGSPRLLAEADRRRLARFLGLTDTALGGPATAELVEVRRLDIAAAAGAGAIADNEVEGLPARFDAAFLRGLGVRAAEVSMIRVSGESMQPTLSDGDAILVDTSDRRIVPGAIHVVRLDGTLVAKRVKRKDGVLTLSSDNPDWPPVVVDLAAVEIVGRVVWLGRRL